MGRAGVVLGIERSRLAPAGRDWHQLLELCSLSGVLLNPVYAGYFVWGRRQVGQRRKAPGRPSTGRVVKDSTEWLVLLPARLPA
jgi:hypothetical protein